MTAITLSARLPTSDFATDKFKRLLNTFLYSETAAVTFAFNEPCIRARLRGIVV